MSHGKLPKLYPLKNGNDKKSDQKENKNEAVKATLFSTLLAKHQVPKKHLSLRQAMRFDYGQLYAITEQYATLKKESPIYLAMWAQQITKLLRLTAETRDKLSPLHLHYLFDNEGLRAQHKEELTLKKASNYETPGALKKAIEETIQQSTHLPSIRPTR